MKKPLAFILPLIIILLTLTACSKTPEVLIISDPVAAATPTPHSTGQIYLYGLGGSDAKTLDKVFEEWKDYYQNENMRHLFIGASYYFMGFLNEWMQSNTDDILAELYKDEEDSDDFQEFYKKIKSECPETIFHGTEIGTKYETIGAQYIKYLEELRLEGSEDYKLALEAIEQGKSFFMNNSQDWAYRENKIVENFIREFDSLNNESVMGVYSAYQTQLDAMDYSNTVPSMASQLTKIYGEAVHSEDISWLVKDIEPLRYDIITVGGKDYEAAYYGSQDMSWAEGYESREFWRLENAYDDFKGKLKTGWVLPYNNYPMLIEKGQVFVIDSKTTEGTIERKYYLSDGRVWEGLNSTSEYKVD